MKKILSIVLAMLMLVSALCIAPVSAVDVEISPVGATMTGGEVLYLIPNDNWNVDSARFACYFYGNGEAWTSMTKVEGEDNLYEVTVPEGSWTNVIFCRMNPANETNSWDNKWNQTGDLTYDGTNNCVEIHSGQWDCGNNVTWSVYTPAGEPEPDASDDEPEDVPTPDPEPTDGYTFYFVDYADNFTEVYAYAWYYNSTSDEVAAADWSGVKMEPTGEVLSESAEQAGGIVYSVNFDKAYDLIIFGGNYGVGEDVEDQTMTLNFTDGIGRYLYWGDEWWYDSIEEIEATFPYEEPDDTEYITVYFQNNWMWDDVSVYFEGSEYEDCASWPGTPMEFFDSDGTYDVYYAEVPADASFIIFNGIKDDGSNQRDQSPDITDFSNNTCYYMTWDNGNAVGSEDISVIFPDYDFGGGEEEEADPYYAGATLTLGGTLGLNLYFDINDTVMADETARIVFTVKGETIEVPVSELSYDDNYGYYYNTIQLAAKEMTEVITAQIFATDFESEVYETTIKEYAEFMLRNYGEFGPEQDIVKAMLNYGTAAQLYFGYNTDKLANDTEYMTDADRTVAVKDLSYYAPVIEGTNDGEVVYVGASLVLKSETSLKFYFTVENADAYENFGINVNGLSGATLEPNGDLYEFVIDDLYAHNLGDTYTLATGCATIRYSAMSYAYLAQQSSKPELVNLANALAAYFEAASLYGGN